LWLNLTKKVQPKVVKPEYPEVYECKFCGSNQITRYGKKTKQFKQRYYCKACQKTFVPDTITRKMWFNPQVVTMTLDLYYKSISLRGTQDHLNQIFNVQLNSHATILNWIRKYEKLIGDYVKTLKPELGKQWHVDEMKVKFGGSWKWLWNVMDKETRFILASSPTLFDRPDLTTPRLTTHERCLAGILSVGLRPAVFTIAGANLSFSHSVTGWRCCRSPCG